MALVFLLFLNIFRHLSFSCKVMKANFLWASFKSTKNRSSIDFLLSWTSLLCNEFKYPTIVVGLWGRIYSRREAIPRHQLLCPKFYERIEGGEGETKAQIALGSKPAFLLLEPQKDSDISLLAIGPKTFWPFSPISINMQPCHPS